MQRILFCLMSLCLCTVLAQAQNSDKRVEGFVGYSNLQAEGLPDRNNLGSAFDDDFFDRRKGVHGVNASVTGYFTSYLGLTGDFSFNRAEDREDLTTLVNTLDTRVTYFMGGPQLKVRGDSRLQPFGRVLFGGANTRFEVKTSRAGTIGNTSNFDVDSTDFAMGVGGGLDVRLTDRFSIRAFQVDYTPVFLRDRTLSVLGSTGALQNFTLEGQRQDNVRFSVGIVF
jgi:opacity protein-like surface antigen